MNLKLTIILPLCCSLLTLFVGCNKYEYARPKPWGTSGKLNANKYDPESVSNPYGKYGSKYSPNSINNPYSSSNTQSSFGSGFKVQNNFNSYSSPMINNSINNNRINNNPINNNSFNSRPSFFGGGY